MIVRIRLSWLMAVIGLGFLGILILQVTRSMYLDAFNIDGTRLDLLGYAFNSALGCLMLIYGWHKRLLRIGPLAILCVFIGLLAINVEFNTQESFKSVILSRYGVLTWLLIGIWTSISIVSIREKLVDSRSRVMAIFSSIWIYVVSLPVAWFAYEVILNRPVTLSYQSVANGGIVLMSTALLSLFAFQKKSLGALSNLPVYILLALSSFLVYAIALLQSTGILAFWVLAFPTVLLTNQSRKIHMWHIVALTLLVAFITWLFNYIFLDELLGETRFKYATDGVLSVSSIQTRIALLPDFLPQFSVSPIFGDFNAEVTSGFIKGEYMHSLLLSLLTHTGIMGFSLFGLAWWSLFLAEQKKKNLIGGWQTLRFRFFILVTILACFYAFFTWLPLWFFIGMLCVKLRDDERPGELM